MDSIFGGLASVEEEWNEAAREAEEAARDSEDSENTGFGCLRCGTPMEYLKKEKIQLGEQGGFGGSFNHLIAGSLSVHIFMCPLCGKIEFFDPYVFEKGWRTEGIAGVESVEEEQIAQVQCPRCGHSHDMDYPKCPFCNYDYNEE